MKIEINIDDYLSEEDKRELCKEYVRETLRGDMHHEERVLSNMAYNSAWAILDEQLTDDQKLTIRNKVSEIISDPSSYSIFRKKDAWGKEDSEAYIEVKKAVSEYKQLINGLVKDAILKRNYDKDLDNSIDLIGDALVDAIKRGLEK